MPTNLRRVGIAALATGLVFGGSIATAGSASAKADFDFTRIKGEDRYATSAEAAESFGQANTVIVASGEPGRYPDALTANYLAGVKNAPVLLTKKNQTPDEVLSAIRDSGARNVIIVGGEAAVSSEQQEALDEDYTVDRLAGSDRFGTAGEIIAEAGDAEGNTALLATGMDFPDALGAGPAAFSQGMPLAITRTDDMPNQLIDQLKSVGINEVVVLGGEGAVSKTVVDELEAKGIKLVERVSGANRAATSVKLAEYAEENFENFDSSAVNVASGYIRGSGADALGGAALTGQQNRALLITRSDKNAGDSIIGYLADNAAEITEGTIFGGATALEESVEYAMEKSVLGSGAQNAGSGELYNTVQDAINAAEAGDTITVFGKDNDGFTVDKADVTIKGEAGAAVSGAIVVQDVDGVTIDGLAIAPTSVANQVAGIYLDGAKGVTITGNSVRGSDSVSDSEAGAGVINVFGGADEVAEIRNNSFLNLTQGVFANPSAQFTIEGNTFRGNVAGSANDSGEVTIRDNRFLGNDEGIGLGVAGVDFGGNSFAASNVTHVRDYTDGEAAYDLQAEIEDNLFDVNVVVAEDGRAIVNESDDAS